MFAALVFWSAPTDPEQFGDALRRLAVALEAQLGAYGFAMVDEIATPAQLENFLPRLRALLQDEGLAAGAGQPGDPAHPQRSVARPPVGAADRP
ncbi:MAG: hypothetical protein ABR608_16255 [Pseudonocardiaceae bacterium]